MSEGERTQQQWMTHVENEFESGTAKVSIPQNSMNIDDAVNLALRLNVTLILADDNFIFAAVDENRADPGSHKEGDH